MAFNLEEVDVDGAVREAADAVSGDTRLSFLKKGAVAGGAALSGGAVLAALTGGTAMAASGSIATPPSMFGKGDVGILNYALTLEYLEAAFYNAASKNNIAGGDKALQHYLTTTKKDENNHVAFLKKGLGKAAVKSPSFDFGKAVTDKNTFAATAYALENVGVGAYLGQAGNIKTPAYLLAAASIVTVEARHAGSIASYLGKPIDLTGSFDKGTTPTYVLGQVKKTGFIKS